MIFTKNNKLYIAKLGGYNTLGFNHGHIWEEVENVPEKIRNMRPSGAAVLASVDGKEYMLCNTSGIACGKWFVLVSEGIRFKAPDPIPHGFKAGYDFIIERYNPVFKYHFGKIDDEGKMDIRISAKLKIEDFTVVKNIFSEVPGLKEYFWEENYDTRVYCDVNVDAKDINKDIFTLDELCKIDAVKLTNWNYAGRKSDLVYSL